MDYVAAFTLPKIAIACERARLPCLDPGPLALAKDDTILAAVSDEAESFGICVGMTSSAARALCQGLVLLPYDAVAYREAAEAVWNLLAVESSWVEPICPELAYVILSGEDALSQARATAQALAAHIRTPVFVGLGSSKIVARHAASSPRRCDAGLSVFVTVVPMGQEAASLSSVAITSLAELPEKTRKWMERRGIKTLGDIISIPPDAMRRQFKEFGGVLSRLAVGEDGDQVRPLWPPAQVDSAWTFEEEVWDAAQVEFALSYCATRIAEALIGRREYCRTLTLTLGLSDGHEVVGWEEMTLPSRDAEALTRTAYRLFRRLPPVETPVLRVNLCATRLGAGGSVQLTLLDNTDSNVLPHERQTRIEAAMGHLRARYGVGAIISARLIGQAQRLQLWTYPLTHQRREAVRVVMGESGLPIRYFRRQNGLGVQGYGVKSIQNRWRESEWNWGQVTEKTCYRVIADPDDGLYELHHLGAEWKLVAAAD